MARMTISAVAVSAVALWAASFALAEEPEAMPPSPSASAPAKPYVIETQLISTTPDGHPTVLSSPRMMILEGRSATVQVGSMVPVPPQGNSIAPIPAEGEKGEQRFVGLTFTAKVHSAENGPTLLDADIERSWMVPGDPQDGFRLTSTKVELLASITLGDKLVVPLGQDAKDPEFRRFEITVTEATNPADQQPATAQRPTTVR